MKIAINGKNVDKFCVTANHGMQFGQFRNDALELDEYHLSLEKDEFVELFEQEFLQARDEIKADDIACNEMSDFTRSGYADLSAMFDFKEDLAEIISTYIQRKLFEVLLPLDIKAGYVINSIDSVEVTDNQIKIIGRTYRWPVNKQRQSDA